MLRTEAKVGGQRKGTPSKLTSTFREAVLLASRPSAEMNHSKLPHYHFRDGG